MFILKIFDGNTSEQCTYRVWFQYKLEPDGRKTLCHIGKQTPDLNAYGGFKYDVFASGYAVCGRRDHFVKDVGRKLALERALSAATQMAGFDRIMRGAFWQAYRYHCRSTKNGHHRAETS